MIEIRSNIKQLRPSDTLTINEQSKKMAHEGKTVYKFGFGQSPFPVPERLQEALRQNAHQKDYLPVQGLGELRERIAYQTNQILSVNNYQADSVFIGPGSKELIFLAQLAIDAPLLLPNPSWVSYGPQATIIGKKTYWIPTKKNHWKLEADILEAFLQENSIQKGILLLNYPNNPTGQNFTDAELTAIAAVCRKRGIIVLSDEIYGLINFDGSYQSIAKFYPEGTLITTGLSKWAGAGGWRLGAMIIPKEMKLLYQTMCALASETFSAVSAPIQYAAIEAYEPHYDLAAYRIASREILQRVANYCYEALAQSGVVLQPSQGGFYLFPDFTQLVEIDDCVEFCQQVLQETGVALLPGSSFGRPIEELTTRLCFVDFDGKAALSYMYKHGNISPKDFVTLFPNMVNGIQRLVAFVKK